VGPTESVRVGPCGVYGDGIRSSEYRPARTGEHGAARVEDVSYAVANDRLVGVIGVHGARTSGHEQRFGRLPSIGVWTEPGRKGQFGIVVHAETGFVDQRAAERGRHIGRHNIGPSCDRTENPAWITGVVHVAVVALIGPAHSQSVF